MNIRKQAVFIARVYGGSGGPEDARSRRSVALRLLLRRAAKVVDGHLSFTNKKTPLTSSERLLFTPWGQS